MDLTSSVLTGGRSAASVPWSARRATRQHTGCTPSVSTTNTGAPSSSLVKVCWVFCSAQSVNQSVRETGSLFNYVSPLGSK